MRVTLTALALLALAGCQPEPKPASESAAAPDAIGAPTAEDLGQDDPSVPFVPAAVDPPRTFEAASKTAMSFTPGALTLTPTPQIGPNHAGGAIFAFANGYTLETSFEPGAATQGEKPFNFTNFIIDPSGAPLNPDQIKMYAVEKETLPTGSANGGFCEKTAFIATYLAKGAGGDNLTIVAFGGDQWPPKDNTALCGTFMYSSAR